MYAILSLFMALAIPVTVPRSVPPQTKVLAQEHREGYVCQLIEYNVSDSERVEAYLLVPDDASKAEKKPGLVLLHDHGARFDIGKEKLVRPMQSAPDNIRLSAKQWSDDNFDGVYFGDRLASLGYVVIVPEQLYWGSRSTALTQKWSRMNFLGEAGDIKSVKNDVYEGQRACYDSLYARGVVWAEKTIHEDAAAARLLKGMDCVQKDRIGCFGWSMGAHRAWLLTAFCKDVRTGVALCWMTLKETTALPYKASDYSMLIPSLREEYDFPDIARWLAPKPFFFLNGLQDKLFPVWSVQRAFADMREHYRLAGAEKQLRTDFFDGPHHCGLDVQEMIISYLQKELPTKERR